MRIFLTFLILMASSGVHAKDLRSAVFAGGCFWCVESDFDHVSGVVETTSGFAGGTVANPSYKQVVRGGTGHTEAVKITYDADVVSYNQLLHVFWRTIDPTDPGGQFCDRGASYRTAVFVGNAAERKAAEASRSKAQTQLNIKVVTEIVDGATFFAAEKYHQDFYRKSPIRYKTYRKGCGRDARVQALWGSDAFLARGS